MNNEEILDHQAETMRQLIKDMDAAETHAAVPDHLLVMQFVVARLKLHMTQHQLAKACGLPQSAIARFESGKSSPTQRTLQRIAKALRTRLVLKDIA